MELVGAALRSHIEIGDAGIFGGVVRRSDLHLVVEADVVGVTAVTVVFEAIEALRHLVRGLAGDADLPTGTLDARNCGEHRVHRWIRVHVGRILEILRRDGAAQHPGFGVDHGDAGLDCDALGSRAYLKDNVDAPDLCGFNEQVLGNKGPEPGCVCFETVRAGFEIGHFVVAVVVRVDSAGDRIRGEFQSRNLRLGYDGSGRIGNRTADGCLVCLPENSRRT